MTDTPPPPASYSWEVSRQARGRDRVAASRRQRESRWTGWVTFGAVMMILAGAWQGVSGLTAIFRSGTYVVGEDRLAVEVDYQVWGWVHILLGVLAVAAGLGLLAGQLWARAVGVVMAVASAITNIAFIPAYPVGSSLIIVLDVLVIYAICVHGRELEDSWS